LWHDGGREIVTKDNWDTESVAKAILRTIGERGIDVIFGLPGVHNLAFWREQSASTPRIVGVRHEQTTVYAADGFARASGRLGVALTTTGPGAANAVGAFGEAAASGSPVVLIASEITTALARPGIKRGVLHESRDQAAMFEPLAKKVYRPRSAEQALRCVAEALDVAMQYPRGPVYLDVPTNVLSEQVPISVANAEEALRPKPSDESLHWAADLIANSKRVVIWAGGGVVQSGAEVALSRLAQRLAAPVVTTFNARGVLSPEHACAVTLPPHEPEVAELIGSADLLLAVGTDFDGMTTRNWSMPMPATLIAINCDPSDIEKNYSPTVKVLGDAKLALEALNELVPDAKTPHIDLVQLHADVWARLRTDDRSALASGFLDQLNAARDECDAVVVADMAIPGYWVGGYGRFDHPRSLQYPVGWGTLGYALPASVGVGALRGKPALAVCGDGGIMFALGELAVLVEEDLPVTILLVDDGGYGMLRYDQDHAGDPRRGVDLGRPDFVAVGRAFGIESVALSSMDEIGENLSRALASRHPQLIVLKVSLTPPRTTSPRWHE
jgi:thiamine pyrophosphate-dependent acetolactate synthase large subunit-like protein